MPVYMYSTSLTMWLTLGDNDDIASLLLICSLEQSMPSCASCVHLLYRYAACMSS